MQGRGDRGPTDVARSHLAGLAARLPPSTVPESVLDQLAAPMVTWPMWPSPGLSELVGPPGVHVRDIGLGWLHRFEATVRLLGWLSGRLGGPSGGPSGLSLLVERAPVLGHRAWGSTAPGGSCRLVRCADGTLAVNLARESDIDAVPAWLEQTVDGAVDDVIAAALASREAAGLVAQARLLGLPVALVGEAESAPPAVDVAGPGRHFRSPPLVVDLSSLWAGPLCGWYLGRAGADVVKVESVRRPDGGRLGAPTFYRRLNGDKHVRDLDFGDPADTTELRRLVRAADIVIEGSRPRALEALGISAAEEAQRGAIWVSITAYGRVAAPDRVGFGDDCAAAAGLVADVGDECWFIGDAAADPITGATAATLALGHWLAGRGALLDVALAPTVGLHLDGTRPIVRL